jgi:DNA-binding GntR family transcriptional regulator
MDVRVLSMAPSKTVLKKPKRGGEVARVYGLLKNWILNCRLRPGDFLPEVELAAQCSTSRTPVREACNRLNEEGWLSKIQNKGFIVAPISIQDIIEVYQFRKVLECFTAERTAQIIDSKEITLLENMIVVERKPNVKISEIVEANDAFHGAISRLAQNQRIADQLKLIFEYVYRLDVLSTQRNAEWVEHYDIFSALKAHDVQGARQAMAEHVDRSRDRMVRLFFGGELPDIDRTQLLLADRTRLALR